MTAAGLLAPLCAGGAAALAAVPVRRRLPSHPGPHGPVAPRATRLAPRLVRWLPVPLGAVALLVGGPVAAVLTGAAAAAVPRHRRRRTVARALDARRSAAGDLLRAFALELAAGLAPTAALAAAAEAPDESLLADLAPILADLGGDVAGALAASGQPRLRDLGACWALSHATGAALAPLTGRLAAVAASQDVGQAEVRAALAGPRASGRMLAGLPVAGVGMAATLGGAPLHFLLRTPAGAVCLLLGVALDAAGLAWLERLARGVRR